MSAFDFASTAARGSPRVQLVQVDNFQGGLNLKADAFQLRGSETPDLLNVDLDARGGFGLRRGANVLNATALPAVPDNIWAYDTTAGVEQVIVQVGSDIYYSAGADFTLVDLTGTTNGRMRAVTHSDVNYVQRNGELAVATWDGSAAATLGASFNENIANPTGANMPRAKLIASHLDYVWVANTTESGTRHPSRLRYSHFNKPGDWRAADYLDIDVGNEGDEITALVPLGEQLIVFKRNSIHAIYGYDTATFGRSPISAQVGAISQESVAVTEEGIYFFSWPEGVFFYNGKTIKWLFERIEPAVTSGTIPGEYADEITVKWLRHRLWVGVPWEAATVNSRVLVYDPYLNQGARGAPDGGWTVYDLPVGPMLQWERRGDDHEFLACSSVEGHVLTVEVEGQAFDVLEDPVVTHIDSYYKTRWFDADVEAQLKRWKRCEFVCDADEPAELFVDVYRDFDPSRIKGSFRLEIEATPQEDVGVWDVSNWDEANWGFDADGIQDIKKGSNLGRARAVQLRVHGPRDTDSLWAVNSITFKLVPKRIR